MPENDLDDEGLTDFARLDPAQVSWATNRWLSPGHLRPRPLLALVVGDTAQPEFAEALAQIRAQTEPRFVARLDEAVASSLVPPDLVIVLVTRPGEFPRAAIEALRSAAPLARVISLAGSWCEGEARSGMPPAGVIRIYAHQWREWFAREMAALAEGRCGTLSLPVTATDEERFQQCDTIAERPTRGMVGIDCARREMTDVLSAACRAAGYEAVDVRSSAPATIDCFAACLWDQPTPDAACFEELRQAIAVVRPLPGAAAVPWIALLSFPRHEDRQQALAYGAELVLSKPLALDDLREALDRLTPFRTSVTAAGSGCDAPIGH